MNLPDSQKTSSPRVNIHPLRKKFLALGMLAFVAMLLNGGHAEAVTTLYWNPGNGNTPANWDTAATNWSTTTSGTGTTGFVTTDAAFFSSTGFTTTPFTANLDAVLNVAGITFGSGAATITASGAGANGLTLSGGIVINSPAGATTLDATLGTISTGTQTWTNNSASGTFTVNSNVTAITGTNSTLTVNGSGAVVIGGTLANNGANTLGLTYNGTNVMTLLAVNTYTGLTTVSTGTLQLGSGASIASGNALTVNSGAFDLNGNSETLGTVSNSGRIMNSSGTPVTLAMGNGSTGAGSWTGNMNIILSTTATSSTLSGSFGNTGNITLNANGTGNIAVSGTVNSIGTITNSGTGAGTTTISGGVGPGVTAITQTGTGSTLTINTAGVTIGAGGLTVSATNSAALSISSAISGTNGGNLTYVASGTGNITDSGSINHNGTISNTGAGTGTVSLNGAIGSNVTGITQNSTSTLVLGGSNSFAGGLAIQSGTVRLGNVAATGTNTVTFGGVGTNGTLDLNGVNPIIQGLAIASGATATSQTIGNGSTSASSTMTFQGGTSTFNGVIQNTLASGNKTVGLTVGDNGALTLGGANTYTGATTVNGNNASLNLTGSLAGSSVTVNNATANFTESSAAGISGGGSFNVTSGTATMNGGNTYTGSTNLNGAGASLVLNGTLNNSSAVTINGAGANLTEGGSGVITGTTTFTVTNGSATLGGANNYTGATTISAGAALTLNGASGAISNSSLITINGGTLTLDNTGVGSNNNNRVGDSIPFSLINANIVYLGSDQAVNSTETITGTLTRGVSTITNNFGGSNASTLTFATLSRAQGSGGIALVNGTNLGSAIPGAGSVGVVRITAGPTLIGTTTPGNSGIMSGTHNLKIVPYLLGESGTAAGANGTATGTANTFLTYNSTVGLRPLNPTDEFTDNAIVAGDNTYITADTTSSASGTTAINSLVINGGNLTIADGTVLKDTSGALLFVTSNTIAPSGSTGGLQVGSGTAEGIISVDAGMTANISAALVGSGTISAYGPGNLVFSGNSGTGAFTSLQVNDLLTITGSNTTSGTITVNSGGVLVAGNDNAFGASVISLGAGTLRGDNQPRTINTVIALGQGVIGGNDNLTLAGGASGIAVAFNANSGALFNVTNTATVTVNGTFSLNNAPTGYYSNNGEGIVVGSSGNVVINGPIVDNNGNIAASGTTVGSLLTLSFHGTGGNITINGNNNFGNLTNAGPVTNNFGYNTLTLGGPGGSGAVITPLGQANISSNTAGYYLQALNAGQILPNNFIFGASINNYGSMALGFTGTNSLTLSGNLTFNPGLILPNISSATLTLSGTVSEGTSTFTLIGSGNNTLASTSALIGTTGGLTTVSTGTLTVSGTTNVTGAESLSGGTVILDYTAGSAGGGTSSRLTNGGTFTMGGVNLQLSGGAFAQTTSGTTLLASGQSKISRINGGSSTIALGAITRNAGGAIDFGSGVATTTTALTGGILGGYATVGGADWATTSSGTIVALSSYTPFVGSAGSSSLNYSLTDGSSVTASESFNSLKILTTQNSQSLAIGSAATLTLTTGGLLFTGTNDYTISGGTLKSNTATNSDLIIQQYGSGVLTISSTIATGAGTTTLTKAGTGTLVLSGNNSYAGTTYILGGKLSISADTNLGTTAGAIVFNGGTLETTAGFSSNRAITLSVNGGTIQVDTGTLSLAGTISSATYSSITKTGTGTLLLSGNNTYAGPTNIAAGILQVGSLTALGAASNSGNYNRTYSSVNVTGGTLDINGFNLVLGNVTLVAGSLIDSSGTATLGAYSYTLQSGTVSAMLGDMVANTSNTGNLVNATALYKTTGGTAVLTASNSYTAATYISGGVLQIGNGGATGQLGAGSVTNNAALAVNLSSTYALSNSISGTGSFSQIGSGVTIMTGANTYTGPTTVLNGKLRVNGTLASNNVTVGNATTGGLTPTLGGGIGSANGGVLHTLIGSATSKIYTPSLTTGYLAGNVTVNGPGSGSAGHLAPGNSVGTMTVGTLTLSGGSILDYEFNGTANDFTMVTTSGGLTINGGGFNLYQEGGTNAFTTNGVYDLIGYTGSIAGTGTSALSVLNQQVGKTYTFGTAVSGGTNYITLTIADGTGVTSTTYSLASTATTTKLFTSGSTSISSVITNTGTGTADTLDYTGLGGSATGGTVNGSTTSGTGLANGGGSGTNSGQTYVAGTTSGTFVVNPVGTGTNHTLGTAATLSGSTPVSVSVYDQASLTASTTTGNQATPANLILTNGTSTGGASGQRAGVTVTGLSASNVLGTDNTNNFATPVTTGSAVADAHGTTTSATVGTASVLGKRLNGTYTETVTGTTRYTDNTLNGQQSVANQTWNITATVSGNASTSRGDVYTANVLSGKAYGTSNSSGFSLGSNLVSSGHQATTATLLNSSLTASATTDVNMSFDKTAANVVANSFRSSDILTLSGLNSTSPISGVQLTDTYVLQLSYDTTATGAQYLGWNNGTQFVNAISGDSTGNTTPYLDGNEVVGAYSGQTTVGTYGYDPTNHVVWAVLNHGGFTNGSGTLIAGTNEFAAIPEPSTWGMILGGFGMLMGFQKLRKRRVGI